MAHEIERMIRLPEILRITGVGTSSIYRWMDKKIFPRPVHLTPGTVAWREGDIARWQQDRFSAQSS